MDLMNLLIEYPKIKTVILIACDTDFVPVVRYLKKSGIDVFCSLISKEIENLNFPLQTIIKECY